LRVPNLRSRISSLLRPRSRERTPGRLFVGVLMRLPLWIAGLWPGLARASTMRRWEGLVLAVAFGAALSAAVIATFVWRRWPAADAMTATVAWGLVVGLWVLGVAWLREDWRALRGDRQSVATPEADTL